MSTAARRRPPTQRAGAAPLLASVFATRYHGTGDGKRAEGGLEIGGKWQPSHGPPRTRQYHSMVVEEAVEVCVSNRRSGRGLRGGWFVPFSLGLPLAISNDRAKKPPPAPRARWGNDRAGTNTGTFLARSPFGRGGYLSVVGKGEAKPPKKKGQPNRLATKPHSLLSRLFNRFFNHTSVLWRVARARVSAAVFQPILQPPCAQVPPPVPW